MREKNRIIVFLIFVFAFLAEHIHVFFEGKIHSYYIRNGIKTPIYWDDMIYYFLNEGFVLFLMIILSIKLGIDKGLRATMASISFWFFIEWGEITLQLAKISDARIYINDGSWLQFFTCLTVFCLVYSGSRK